MRHSSIRHGVSVRLSERSRPICSFGLSTRLSQGSQDIHVDMAELVVWSRDLTFGFNKHPPLAAMVVNVWFRVFPIADWSYYLLSVLVATLALWIAWRLSADYLDAEKRVIGVALLTLIPFFNFLALTFNVNVILMPLWA